MDKNWKVIIEYCEAWQYSPQAASLADALKAQFAKKVQDATMLPSERTGCFEVFLQEELVYSKLNKGRLPHPGEVEKIILERLAK